jgi:hypothetical protein
MVQHAFRKSDISLSLLSHCACWYNQNLFRLRRLFNTLLKDPILLSSYCTPQGNRMYWHTIWQMESIVAPHCICYHMLFHNMTCLSSFLMNTVTPNIDLAISLAFLPSSQSSLSMPLAYFYVWINACVSS